MKGKRGLILALAMISLFTVTTLFFLGLSEVGGVKPEKPDPMEQVMIMLDAIYDIVLDTNSKVEGVLIQRTGQTESFATRDDGDLQKGEEWPDPRFTDNGDGTVTDHLTGLIWLKNLNCFGQEDWETALTDCNSLNSGECGLTDDSVEGDWHLPNIRELLSLIHWGDYAPPLGDEPFPPFETGVFWSSTTSAAVPDAAWGVDMYHGDVSYRSKTSYGGYVWPVRGDN